MNGLLNLLGSRGAQTAAGGLLGLAAGGPAGLLAGAAGGRLFGGLVREGQRRNTAAEQALEAKALEIERGRMQNEAAQRQQGAMQALPGLLSAPVVADNMVGPPRPETMRATDQQQGLLGALTQLAPQSVAQGVAGRVFPQPTKPSRLQERLGLLSAAGVEITPDVAMRLAGAEAQPEGGLEDLQRRVQIELDLAKLSDRRTSRQEDEDAEAESEALDSARNEGLVLEARNVNEQLEELSGTLLDAGSNETFSKFVRGVSGVVGPLLESGGVPLGSEMRGTNAARDDFSKSLSRLRNAAVDMLVPEGATNAQREQAAEGFPSVSMEPAAIRAGIRSFAEDRLRALKATGADQRTIKHFEDLIKEFGDSGSGGASQPTLRYNPQTGEFEPL